jgi:hypothetical protein
MYIDRPSPMFTRFAKGAALDGGGSGAALAVPAEATAIAVTTSMLTKRRRRRTSAARVLGTIIALPFSMLSRLDPGGQQVVSGTQGTLGRRELAGGFYNSAGRGAAVALGDVLID